MEHEHTREAIQKRLADGGRQSYLRDFIYGGVDGIVTTFAIVSGVTGAQLAPGIILILGGASLVADGFAMAAGDFLATKAEQEEYRHAEAIERRHIELYPSGERDEIREILLNQGIAEEVLEAAVGQVTANPERWVRMMLRDEYGLPAAVRSPWRAAGSTFSAFLICGLIPLLPFLAGVRRPFEIAAAVTAVVFLGIGALKSRWSVEPWWLSALSTLAIGGGAAVVAYFAGAWLRGFAG